MMQKINPWLLGDETSDKPRIPGFCQAKYIVTKIVPPKTGTIRDGLVMHSALISYIDNEGVEVTVTKVTEGPGGYEVEFPLGKHLVTATKYRGPKSWYNFVHPETGKWIRIPQEKFTEEFAISYLKSNLEDWEGLSDIEKAGYIDDYFEDMYMFGLANDFNFDTTKEAYDIPKIGMVANFYRRYTPPAEGEKYGNTIITKWPSSKIPAEKDYPKLDGTFEMKDHLIAEAIITALTTNDKAKEFDPTSSEMPF